MKKLNIAVLFVILFAILFICSTAYAEPVLEDTVTGYYSISPVAFDPEYYGTMWQKSSGRLWSYSTNAQFYASVYLPDSARVTEFKAWVHDSFSTNNIEVSLYRVQLSETGPYPMANAASVAGGGDQELTDAEIDYDLIDKTAYKYNVRVRLFEPDSRHALYGMRIKYELIQGGTAVDGTSETVGSMPIKEIFPIPFSYETVIKYEVPKTNTVSIKIFDEAGRLVRTLVDNTMSQGSYSARWDGRDTEGRKVAAGCYFCVVKTNGHSTTKVVYIK